MLMEGSSLFTPLSCSPPTSAAPDNLKPQFNICLQRPSFYSSSPSSIRNCRYLILIPKFLAEPSNLSPKLRVSVSPSRASLRSSAFAIEEALGKRDGSSSTVSAREMSPKIDKSGRFCSPRAARELALSIIYAACLEGSDPVRLFEKRLNSRREPGYEFDKEKLLAYNHMSFGGPPITVESVEEANELLQNDEKESAIEAEVLAAPPKLVYSKVILRFTRKLLVAVMDRWDINVVVINKVAPANWKNEPASRILELSILHLAMSEMAVLGARHQIVINEAVDLAKRFCDGAAPRIINGCLRTFIKDLEQAPFAEASDSKPKGCS